ncbi:triacylglycerol lipase OBL1 [Tanacetum coccineum]
MAAKSAYENPAYIKQTVEKHWKMEFLGFFNCWNDYEEDYTTQGFMWGDKTGESELIGVSFRGTSPFNAKDWSSDVDLSWYDLPGIGKVHAGFLKALGLQKSQGWPKDIQVDDQKIYAYYAIRQKLKDRLQNNPNAKFLITGHSLGAALAIMFPAVLAHHNETDLLSKLEGVYTFGQPRVGNHKFGEYMKEVLVTHGMRYHRFVYCNDLVPRVPFDNSDLLFKHFGDCHYYNSFYKGQVVTEEPNKNYFSVFAIIPMFANAMWELLRSFIIYYQRGPEYCETYTCRGLRVFGLLIAGLPAHSPQDYVNLTRLGASYRPLNRFISRSHNGQVASSLSCYDRARGVRIGNMDVKLEYLEEAFTTSNLIVRIYKVKPPDNRWLERLWLDSIITLNYYEVQYGTLCIRENLGYLFLATNCDDVTHLIDAQEWAVNNIEPEMVASCKVIRVVSERLWFWIAVADVDFL